MRLGLGASLFAATLALVACGGDDGSDEDQIRTVAAAYLRAMAVSDGETLCSASSETQQAKILLGAGTRKNFDDCADAVDSLGEPFGAEDYEAMAGEMDGAEVTIEDSVAAVQLPPVGDESGGSGPYLLFAVDENGDWKVDELR